LGFLTVAVVGCVGGSTRRFTAEVWWLELVGLHLLLGKKRLSSVTGLFRLKREQVF